jgi:hypothetical protein
MQKYISKGAPFHCTGLLFSLIPLGLYGPLLSADVFHTSDPESVILSKDETLLYQKNKDLTMENNRKVLGGLKSAWRW